MTRFDSCCNDFGDWCAALSRALQNEVYTTGMVVKHVGTKADLEALGLKAGGTTGWLKSEAVYQLLLENHHRFYPLPHQTSPTGSPCTGALFTDPSACAGQKTEVRQGWQGWRGKRGAWRASKPPHASSRCATENAAIAEILDANGTSASRRTSATKKTAGIGATTPPYPASGVA